MIMNRKADGGLIALVVILIIIIVLGLMINVGNKECRKDSQCSQDHYCGSDFKCHQHPIIEKIVVQKDLVKPSFIIGLAIIIAALIFKGNPKIDFSRFRKKKKSDADDDNEEDSVHNHDTKMPKHSTRLP